MTKSELRGGKDCPLSHSPPSTTEPSLKMLDWAQEQCNKDAWKEVMKASKGGITRNTLEEDVSQCWDVRVIVLLRRILSCWASLFHCGDDKYEQSLTLEVDGLC
ncbi:hypothetical protein BS50DRAFT_580676 [Corynespora cassiicola Philippines]|uniref:Uncharacterized protein n=1 Tax=Corynespora cassiicola Philippines TaxID=1448308 RepID=A0A2T2P8V4_CORCC|nr:hypothetical protein BS50DRAFT_580676 [Corynespora cassiicola Philippines]